MPAALTTRPDAVVLGAGGTLGIQWLRGVCAGLEDAGLDLREAEYFVGTSAGSVVAALLAAGRSLRDARPPALASDATEAAQTAGGVLEFAARLTAAATAPFAPAALAVRRRTAPLRGAVLLAAPRKRPVPHALRRHLEAVDARFDGRLRIAAVDRKSGKRVMFGSPKAPAASVADASMASCAIPWVFAPVEIGGREYVDGGVWSPSNADAIPAGRGAEVLCLLPLLSPRGGGAPARALRAASQTMAFAEVGALRARGARVRVVAPDAASSAAIGPNVMAGRRRQGVYASGFAQGHALTG